MSSTISRISVVFVCTQGHYVPGASILKMGQGYECPFCHTEVMEANDSQAAIYFQFVRGDRNPGRSTVRVVRG